MEVELFWDDLTEEVKEELLHSAEEVGIEIEEGILNNSITLATFDLEYVEPKAYTIKTH